MACWRYGTREAIEMLAVCVVLNRAQQSQASGHLINSVGGGPRRSAGAGPARPGAARPCPLRQGAPPSESREPARDATVRCGKAICPFRPGLLAPFSRGARAAADSHPAKDSDYPRKFPAFRRSRSSKVRGRFFACLREGGDCGRADSDYPSHQ